MLSYIRISTLNDFLFCPKSIYFHELYEKYEKEIYQEKVQIAGALAHENIDKEKYASSKHILQSLPVFSEKWGLIGKIDLFNTKKKLLTERKKKIKRVYQGYIYQLWAQYFCLQEMGYVVEKMQLYSLDDNKVYPIDLPKEVDQENFRYFLEKYREFDPTSTNFWQNPDKCIKCIYHELCDFYQG